MGLENIMYFIFKWTLEEAAKTCAKVLALSQQVPRITDRKKVTYRSIKPMPRCGPESVVLKTKVEYIEAEPAYAFLKIPLR
jgi:hypothetical protein